MSSQKNVFIRSRTSQWRREISCLPAVAALFCTSHAFAAVPAVVADAQQTIAAGSFNPPQVAVAPNGTVYVSDTNNNRVLQFIPNLPSQVNGSQVSTPGYTLASPQGLAVDAAGDLYIADTPSLGTTSRIIEVMATSNGSLGTTVKQIFRGGFFLTPLAMTVDSANTLFIGDSGLFGAGAIYSIAAGSSTPKNVATGLTGFTPSALARDGSGNLYFVNSAAGSGGVYKVAATGGTAQSVSVGSFSISQPAGLALDGAGDLFVLATVGVGRNSALDVLEIPAGSPSTPYIIPTLNLQNSASMALDPSGNLDLAGGTSSFFGSSGSVIQLNFSNPVDMGSASVFGNGTGIVFNFEFNAPATLACFRAVTVGDQGTSTNNTLADVVATGSGNCKNQTLSSSTTALAPYTCNQTFQATPQYTGMRASAIQVKGPVKSGVTTILDSTPVYETGLGAAQVTYPLDATITATGLIQPQGITASGFDQTVYIADMVGGKVYSTGGLGGSSLHLVSTGNISLESPSAVAINAQGDLFIADFDQAEVIVVPTTTGLAPYVLNTGNLLQHPGSLTVDFLGDLFIGDAGASGFYASSTTPGYVVEVPYKGSAFKLPTPGVTVIFPQSLVVDSLNGDLIVADGGDVNTGVGQTVRIPASGANATVVSITGEPVPTQPTGVAFDAAENLYVLDSATNTITVVPTTGPSHLLNFDGSSLMNPSDLVSSAGTQSFVIANIGNGTDNNLLYLNGNSSTLAFGNQAIHTNSQTQTATVANIGNQNLTLSNPYYSGAKSNQGFTLLGSSTCTAHLVLTALTTCSMNLQFQPTTTGAKGEQLTINSNAYNAGNGTFPVTPQLNLTGTGTSAAGQAQVAASIIRAVSQAHVSQGGKSKNHLGRRNFSK
jgi:sugar lactone lactonase YvrE